MRLNGTIKKTIQQGVILLTLSFMTSCSLGDYNQDAPDKHFKAAVMVDPSIDLADKEWCYLQNPTTVICVPYLPDAVQVTYDGALFTREAELCFFSGPDLKPVNVRQKTWLHGWIPVVQFDWKEVDIANGGSLEEVLPPTPESLSIELKKES
jgi:hypothetical protein